MYLKNLVNTNFSGLITMWMKQDINVNVTS